MAMEFSNSDNVMEIRREIEGRAPYYTPEWRYNSQEPDPGTALAFIWADMLAGVRDRYRRAPDNYRRALLDVVGSEPLPPLPAGGYLCFRLLADKEWVMVPAGTSVGAEADPEAVLVTERELVVTQERVVGIYYTDPAQDLCRSYDVGERIPLFEGGARGEHVWTFTHPYAFDVAPGAVLRLECRGRRGFLAAAGGTVRTAGGDRHSTGVTGAYHGAGDRDAYTGAPTSREGYETAGVAISREVIGTALIAEESRHTTGAALIAGVNREAGAAALTGPRLRWQGLRDGRWLDFLSVVSDGEDILLRFPREGVGICTAIRFILTDEGAYEGLTMPRLLAGPEGLGLAPEALYAEDAQAAVAGCYPFGRRYTPYNCFYLTCREALSKPGAVVELSFDAHIEEFPIEGYPLPEIVWKRVMRPKDVQPPEEYEIAIADVAWEYYNGTGWASLTLEREDSRTVFARLSKEPRGYAVRFTCPADMATVVCGAHDALFIRARVVSVDNLFRTRGHYLTPWLARPRFRYHYLKGIEIGEAVVEENLERYRVFLSPGATWSGQVSPDSPEQRLAPPPPLLSTAFDGEAAAENQEGHQDLLPRSLALSGRVSTEPAIYLAFDRPISSGTLLFHLDSITEAAELRWEYYTADGWTVLDTHDETGHLRKTGLVTYQTLAPAAPLRLMGREGWWIRLIDRYGGYADRARPRPVLVQIYENAAPALARHPGDVANLPADSYRNLTSPIPGIAAVFNPLEVRGGCGAEDEARVIRRLTACFNHGDRGVSSGDLENLTKAASLQVLRCRCFPGVNQKGQSSPGDTCLVILRAGSAAEQEHFTPLREQITEYLAARLPLALMPREHLHLVEPNFTRVHVTLSGGVRDMAIVLTVKRRIQEEFARYLDPAAGGAAGTGWAIGDLPSPNQLAAVLKSIEGLLYIQSLEVAYTKGFQEGSAIMNYTDAIKDPFAMPQNGQHVLEVLVER